MKPGEPLLEGAGFNVIAVQIPLSSLEADIEATNRAIERLEEPVVLVGHSLGGLVITEAGLIDKVQSLVSVAAFAMDEGQSLGSYTADFPHAEGLDHLDKDDAGYYRLTDKCVAEHFAFDLPKEAIAAIAASQCPINSASLGTPVKHAAWKTKPNFTVVSTQDRMTQTDIQCAQVDKLNAKAVEADTSHVPILTYPNVAANMIVQAAK